MPEAGVGQQIIVGHNGSEEIKSLETNKNARGLRDLIPYGFKRLFSRRKVQQIHEGTSVSSSQKTVAENTQVLTNEQDLKPPERLNKITIPPEKLSLKGGALRVPNPLDRDFIDEVIAYFPQMPEDWRILALRWKSNGGQSDLPGDIYKIREKLGELASRPDVAVKLNEFREDLRKKFGDTIPVYRGSGEFKNSPPSSLFNPSSKFTSVSTSPGVAATFAELPTREIVEKGMLEKGMIEVEVTKYFITPEDVVAFIPSGESELIIRRETLEQMSMPEVPNVKK